MSRGRPRTGSPGGRGWTFLLGGGEKLVFELLAADSAHPDWTALRSPHTNMHLLFWLSLVPFVTGWMGENDFAATPTAVYGVVLLMAAIASYVLVRAIIRSQGERSLLAEAIGRDLKSKASPILSAIAIPAAFWQPSGGASGARRRVSGAGRQPSPR